MIGVFPGRNVINYSRLELVKSNQHQASRLPETRETFTANFTKLDLTNIDKNKLVSRD